MLRDMDHEKASFKVTWIAVVCVCVCISYTTKTIQSTKMLLILSLAWHKMIFRMISLLRDMDPGKSKYGLWW